MRKANSGGKKKKAGPRKKKKLVPLQRIPRPIKNPAWLRKEPEGDAPVPPVQPQQPLLPFTSLGWENFERLCLRLSERGAKVEAAWAYGKPGHTQYGIDVLVRMQDGSFHVWQSKRYKSISKSTVKAVVGVFLKHKWAKKATRFVLAVACEFHSPGVVDAIEEARITLQGKNIEFEPLDASKMTEHLRTEPELVDVFFRRPWVEVICPPEALERLKCRLSRFDIVTLRTQLQSFYNSWISTVDPGLPIVGQDAEGRTLASIPITDRYIQPDLLVRDMELEVPAATASTGEGSGQTVESRTDGAESGKREPFIAGRDEELRPTVERERRVPLDEYLSSTTQTLIVGEARKLRLHLT